MPPEIHRNLVTDNQRHTLHTICPDLLNSPEIWDTQWVGVQVFKAEMLMQGKDGRYASVFQQHQQRIELFMCSCLGKGIRDIPEITRDPLHRQRWNNMQSVLQVPQVYASSLHGLLSHSYATCHLPFHLSFGLENNFLTPFLQITF